MHPKRRTRRMYSLKKAWAATQVGHLVHCRGFVFAELNLFQTKETLETEHGMALVMAVGRLVRWWLDGGHHLGLLCYL